MTDDSELQRVLAVVNHVQQLLRREREDCPCGQHVEALEQVGQCMYTVPCGHRIRQGLVPTVWRTDRQCDDTP